MKALTKKQVDKIWKENHDYLFWLDDTPIEKKELEKFLITDDERFITLSDVDFYIEI